MKVDEQSEKKVTREFSEPNLLWEKRVQVSCIVYCFWLSLQMKQARMLQDAVKALLPEIRNYDLLDTHNAGKV